MADVPAWCPRCQKTVTPTHGGINLGSTSRGITVRGFATCPDCGGSAQFLEGTFDGSWTPDAGEALKLVAGSEWTRQRLIEFQEALRRAAANPESAVDEVAPFSPETADFLQRLKLKITDQQFVALLVALTGLGTLLLQGVATAIAVLGYLEPEPVPTQQIFQVIESNPKLREQLSEVQERLNRLERQPTVPESEPESAPSPATAPDIPARDEIPHEPPATGSPG